MMAGYDELKARSEKLGVPVNSGIYKPKNVAWDELQISEYELHRRLREEQRHRRHTPAVGCRGDLRTNSHCRSRRCVVAATIKQDQCSAIPVAAERPKTLA
jgi:hypothetical protein